MNRDDEEQMEMTETEALYVEFVRLVDEGDAVGIEEYAKLHPQHRDALLEIHRIDRLLAGRSAHSSFSLSESLRRSFGEDVDPGVTLEEEEDVSGSDLAEGILARLGERQGTFGRYHLKGEVARGGQGVVVRVWDTDLRRHLAMKVIIGRDESSSDDEVASTNARALMRFLDEAQITCQLDHPGIVPVHELGVDSTGRAYFTMKLVKGRTLKEVFDEYSRGEGEWTQTRLLGVLLKVCESMSYAHAKGVIHRDLKPSNIMVGKFGEAYVMDWGLAHVLGQKDRKDIRIKPSVEQSAELHTERRSALSDTPDSPLLTMDGDVVGTPSFMSP